ncbi:DUF4230 domain-containing protein [Leptolyngbya sp. FACHB-36]|uniref:DUF4230 domain-containing protein n=1 Tax=Leptolyngbya sp. FACHB-36 TaxID=2692808 RepID=UPI0016801C0A|nr:DUF4230 domain-containing protein [Leptolyngbya sp. FACHB-36]MBD2021698.1 DUF4230 domain-containing protein [Leptolyngbya sp. FACHB-36]
MGQNKPKRSWKGVHLLRMVQLGLAGSMLLTGLLILVSVWRSGDRWVSALGNWFGQPPPPKVDVQSVVIQQVRNVSELTTATFTMQAVVPASQDSTVGSWVVGTTKLLYIAYGEVRAGVDLSKLRTENVQVVGEQVRIQLPPPQLLDSKIDVSRSTVYDYNRGVLNLGPDVAPQLQTLAQQQALKTIQTAACQNGLLTTANDRAKLVVTQLLTTAGYKQVSVEMAASSIEACLASGRTEK